MGAQIFRLLIVSERVRCMVCLASHDPALARFSNLVQERMGCESMFLGVYQTARNVTSEHVNMHDMQSIRLTL